MFLTVHVAVGALIGQQVQTPLLAFILGYFSHWLIDAIPHGDETLISDKLTAKQKNKLLVLISSLDLFGVLILLFSLYNLTPININLVAAGFGAVLPDLFWGTSSLLPFKLPWEFLNVIHNKFHTYFKQRVNLKTGLIIQALTLILTVLAIVR